MGQKGGVLLLTEDWMEPDATYQFNEYYQYQIRTAYVLGGRNVVWSSVMGMIDYDLSN